MVEDEDVSPPTPTPLPLSPLGGNMDVLPGDHIHYLSLYLGFDHVIGSVAVDGSGLNNDARLTQGNYFKYFVLFIRGQAIITSNDSPLSCANKLN